ADILGKAEQKFRSLLEAAPDAMVIGGEDGRISLVNSQVEAIFGFGREELIGENIRVLVPEWSSRAIHPGSSAAQERGHLELWAMHKSGRQFPVELSLSPLQTEEGLLLTTAIRDITQRRRAEDAVRELNLTLEQRVAERTEELLQSNKALQQSNDDLNQFAYAASHDLQEPLRMVSLYSQMLQRKYGEKLDAEADEFIAFIVGGAKRMEQLLRDLLAYSQTGSSSEGPVQPVDCDEAMRKVVLNLRASVEQNNASITWDALPTVHAHEIRLMQLLQNLISNAIKYRSEEPPVIRVSAERRGSDWQFAVNDNGIGIDPEYAHEVFRIFRRLHGHDYPGTGIGLAICQRIVERYGGRIWVESSLGRGSRFCFTFPVGAQETRDDSPAPMTDAAAKQQAAIR
ncbi:MAG TPA: ATP-binding protein, partial [Bryobacteraceae bacterium]|nr:ATP-binding protein [Bryobacteraceae bacterium]